MARTSKAVFAWLIMGAVSAPAVVVAQANDLAAPAPVEREETISVVAPAAAAPAEDVEAPPTEPRVPTEPPTAESAPEPQVDTVFEEPTATGAAIPNAPSEARSSSDELARPTGYGAYGTAGGAPIGPMTTPAATGVEDSRRRPGHAVQVDDRDASRLPRIAVMTLAGAGTMMAAGFGMYEVGCALGGGRDGSSGCFAIGMPMAIAAGLSLTPLSVWLTGQALDGNGGYGWTLMGTGIGTVAGTLGGLFAAVSGASQDEALIPMMIGPVLGAVVAYEASSNASRSAIEEAERRASQPTVNASLGPTDGGGMVSVYGTF